MTVENRIDEPAPPVLCLCGAFKKARRRMCAQCEADPVKRGRNLWIMERERWDRQINEAAERETAGLPEGPPCVPVLLDRLINEWGR